MDPTALNKFLRREIARADYETMAAVERRKRFLSVFPPGAECAFGDGARGIPSHCSSAPGGFSREEYPCHRFDLSDCGER